MIILIPIKSKSIRCPNKNKILLPYTLNWLESISNQYDVWIVTDKKDYFTHKKYSYNIYEWVENDRNNCQDEFTSIYKFLNWYKENIKEVNEFIWLPATQPSRSNDLLSYTLDNYDLLTSYVTITDRSIFEIEDNSFKIKDIPRCGSACVEKKIADGAIYITTYDFIQKCINSLNPNKTFWNSNIKFIENKSLLVDIDTKKDLEKYESFTDRK